MDKYQLLQRYWGYAQFRPLQELIVDAVADHARIVFDFMCWVIGLFQRIVARITQVINGIEQRSVQVKNDRHVIASVVRLSRR